MSVFTQKAYEQLKVDFLKKAEGITETVYLDTAGIPTIGIGLNLALQDNVEDFLTSEYGNFVLSGGVFSTTGIQLRNDILALTQAGGYNSGGTLATQTAQEVTLQNSLNTLIRNYIIANSSATSSAEVFGFDSNQEAADFFLVTNSKYEAQLTRHLTKNSVTGLATQFSSERLALWDLTYNIGSVGSNLTTALKNNDRVRAWYEIRYRSNADGVNAKRRFAAAAFYGLYDKTMTATQITSIITFLNGSDPYSVGKTVLEHMVEYETTYSVRAQDALNDYGTALTGFDDQVRFQDVFLPIASNLAKHFGRTGLTNPDLAPSSDFLEGQAILAAIGGMTINNEVVIGLETNNVIQSTNKDTDDDGNDLLIAINTKGQILSGGAGDDLLIGAAGDDKLYGDTDNDLLIGNKGNDFRGQF